MIQPRSPPAFTLQSEYKEMDKTTKSEIWKSTVLCWETALHCMVPFFTVGLCPRWPGDGGWHHMVSLPPFIDSQIFTLVLNSQPTMSRNTAELSFTADQMTFLVRGAVNWGQSPRRRRFSYALHVWQKTNWSNTWWQHNVDFNQINRSFPDNMFKQDVVNHFVFILSYLILLPWQPLLVWGWLRKNYFQIKRRPFGTMADLGFQ